MKSLSVKRIGALAAGALMLGASLAAPVNALFDDTGLTKGFFYDSNYNPMVQVVVGEKGLASDSVAAGNIAATIGNLAYYVKSSTATGSGGKAEGEVTIGVSAMGASGKFEQEDDSYTHLTSKFYDDSDGLIFTDETYDYQKGEFVSYSLACDSQTRTEAGILKEGTYANVHCLFCETLCQNALENPDHDMQESIVLDGSGGQIRWYEEGLGNDDPEYLVTEIDKNTIQYQVDTGEIPLTDIKDSDGDEIDFEWRGKFLLFGEEYFVKDIDTDEIDLAKGKTLEDISSEGYTSEYLGYKFKVDHLIYSGDYEVAGILLDVEKPDGTVVQTQISKRANGIVDDIEIAGVYAAESDAVATANLLVYDTGTNIHLEDGEDIMLGGEVNEYWRVRFGVENKLNSSNIETSDYKDARGSVLENLTITYRHDVVLGEGESLDFPTTYKVSFNGFRTNDFRDSLCSGQGEGNIVIRKDGDYQLLMGFTADDGNRYNDVRLDQGPFTQGDVFMINGRIFKLRDVEEDDDNEQLLRITLEDEIDGGSNEYELMAVDSNQTNGSFILNTIPFVDYDDNTDDYEIEPDEDADDSDVFYSANILGIPMLYSEGDLFLDIPVDLSGSGSNDQMFGVSADQIGVFDDFEDDGNRLFISAVEEMVDLTPAANTEGQTDTDDVLLKIRNEEGEYVYLDLYDRNYDSGSNAYYDNALIAATDDIVDGYDVLPAANTIFWLDEDEDTDLYLPRGGDRFTVDWGGDYEIESVSICHPQDEVDATIFIGTTEEEAVMESLITSDDVGTEVTAGCCSFTVVDFGVEGEASVSVDERIINDVGNLVVAEANADQNKNLIIVGGPVVNGLSTATVDEIRVASGQYVVRKDNKRIIVAGLGAGDTLNAGNALIQWLKDHAHAA